MLLYMMNSSRRLPFWFLVFLCLTAVILAGCRSQPTSAPTAVGFAHDHLVYIGHEQQVQVYDVSRLDNLQLIATWAVPGPVRRIVTDGARAYVAHHPSVNSWSTETGPPDGGVQLVDVSRPRQPQIQGYFRTRSGAEDVVLQGHVVYVIDWDGVYAVDWRNPAHPQETSNLPQRSNSLEVDGDLLLGGWGNCSIRTGFCSGGLWLADISQRQKPRLLAEIPSEQDPVYSVGLLPTAAHRYAVMAGRGLWVVDVTNPAAPREVARQTVADGFYYSRVVVKENYAILTTDAHIRVYEMSRPEAPRLVGQMDWPSPPLDMMLAGNGRHLYLASWDGLAVIDVSDPQRPFLAAATYANPIPPPAPTASP
jgi:hypothetical protein